jgi:hypothetical protein
VLEIVALAQALEGSALGAAMRNSLWLYPIVEIVHIAGLAVLVGSVAMLDLRLLGFTASASVRDLARHVLPWTWAALFVVIPSGLAMFSAHAVEFLDNPALRVKLLLIAFAGVNAAAFHFGVFRTAPAWDRNARVPPAARWAATLSLVLWLGVIASGRLIAYL